jgi:hypothetical protein
MVLRKPIHGLSQRRSAKTSFCLAHKIKHLRT